MINIAIDFNAAQAAKFGADYNPEDHVKEIFPALSSVSDDKPDPTAHIAKKIKLARNGEGEDRTSDAEHEGKDDGDAGQLADNGGHGELQQ